MKATDSPFKNPILHHSNYQTIITNKVLILYNQYTHSKVLWIQIKSQYYHQNIFLQPKYHFKEKVLMAMKLNAVLALQSINPKGNQP